MLIIGKDTLYGNLYVSAERIGYMSFFEEYRTSHDHYKFRKTSNTFDKDLEKGESRRCTFCKEQFEILKFSKITSHTTCKKCFEVS